MDFEERIEKLVSDSIRECSYNPQYLRRMVKKHGAVEATRRLLHRPEDPSGLARLVGLRRLDLSLEAVILEPEWEGLFTPEEFGIAERRLRKYGYEPRRTT